MIKKRLAISNIIMLVIPAILIVVIAGGLLEAFTEKYGKKIRIINEGTGTYKVQKALDSYIKEINDKDIDTEKIEENLKIAGYNLLITDNGNTVFSNLTYDDKDAISKINDGLLSSSDSIVLEVNAISLIKNSILNDGKRINIIAIKSNKFMSKQQFKSDMRTFFISYISVVLIIALIIITLTNGILSSRVAKSLIEPLDLLSYGAGQIEEGNLEFKMNYDGNDEFSKVCADFDKMRIRLKESIDMKLKYEEDRKELVAGISHDLRTPLTTIKGYAKGLKDGVANTPEKCERYHEIIYSKACDMDMLVDKLFLFSKLDTGKFPFIFEKVNCNDFFLSFLNIAVNEFKIKGLNCIYENNCENNVYFNIDCEEMHRVLANILENSVKYKEKDIGNAKIKIDKMEDEVVIKIQDDGPGVKEENLSRLFKGFFREDASRSNPSEGSGLGLSIAEYIMKAHKGTIRAENNNGLTIIMTLPIYNE